MRNDKFSKKQFYLDSLALEALRVCNKLTLVGSVVDSGGGGFSCIWSFNNIIVVLLITALALDNRCKVQLPASKRLGALVSYCPFEFAFRPGYRPMTPASIFG